MDDLLSLVSPDNICLSIPAEDWEFTDPKLNFAEINPSKVFADSMFEFMVKSGGIGLAAPQIGVSRRVFVMGNDNWGLDRKLYVFNPKIIEGLEEEICEEGCLTFPLLFLHVKRYKKISVAYQDENANTIERQFDGIMARCFQHELDHLNGVLFINHVSKLKLDMAIKKRNKVLKRTPNVSN